jgi:hypothetical protein
LEGVEGCRSNGSNTSNFGSFGSFGIAMGCANIENPANSGGGDGKEIKHQKKKSHLGEEMKEETFTQPCKSTSTLLITPSLRSINSLLF